MRGGIEGDEVGADSRGGSRPVAEGFDGAGVESEAVGEAFGAIKGLEIDGDRRGLGGGDMARGEGARHRGGDEIVEARGAWGRKGGKAEG
jgi:hypothetical protein